MSWRAPWMLLLMLPLLSGADAAESRLRDFRIEDLRTVHYWANMTHAAAEAALARQEADTNDDGQVNGTERAAYEAQLRQAANAGLGAPQATLDNATPTEQEVLNVTIRGLEGGATSSAPIEVDYHFRLAWPGQRALKEHSFMRELRREDAGPARVTVPPEHVALRGRGLFEYRVSEDARTVEGRVEGGGQLEVVFGHKQDAPERASFTVAPTTTPAQQDPVASTPPSSWVAASLAAAALLFRKGYGKRP